MITENQLDNWVRGNSREAQGAIVNLVYRLWAASCPNPNERRIPLGDSIGQRGTDGFLNTDFPYEPFVPSGKSFWEIGTGSDPRGKATSDYKTRTRVIPQATRLESTFLFVTPLSGVHEWPLDAQTQWLEDRKALGEWRDIRVIDGTKLIDWIYHFPAVEHWMAQQMGVPLGDVQTTDQRWAELQGIGSPPLLTPEIFLSNRGPAREKLGEIFSGTTTQLQLDTHYPGQVADFVAAHLAAIEPALRLDIVSRCLIISRAGAWQSAVSLRDPHILVANFDVDVEDPDGSRILDRARRAKHAVIFGSPPGGIPHGNRVTLTNPKVHELKDALQKAGYAEERARMLAQQCDGQLTSLVRCLQNLSVMPEWAQGTAAADLVVVQLLGGWTESSQGDIEVVETISKKEYGEWIEGVRDALTRPPAPLTQQDGVWKATQRYEAWYALGAKIFDDQLERVRQCAVRVLREKDPKFELPADDRPAASIHGKSLSHSGPLRKGLADTLALLGSHPNALTSCSFGRAQSTAVIAVREILRDADWILWASLNDLLPLLAEAAPSEFLSAVETALSAEPSPFDSVFAEESSGIGGRNYMTGLLWALETLAWDGGYLTRALVILGELGAHDPGGNWANRPSNSLSTILLPWLPQTCASLEKRKSAVATLMKEFPTVGWKLLLDLLPSGHGMSIGSRKPAWRETISENWTGIVSDAEYWDQIAVYADLTLSAATADGSRLPHLIERIDNLPSPQRLALLKYLRSDPIVSASESDRFQLWAALQAVVLKHRKFSGARWAMEPELVDEVASVSELLAPQSAHFRHHRLFDDADIRLYEEVGNYAEQSKRLEEQRTAALAELLSSAGFDGIAEFAKTVRSPWRVGAALGGLGTADLDAKVLPSLLEVEPKPLAQVAATYVLRRFHSGGKWTWVDGIDTTTWSNSEKAQFLAYLPFAPATWKRAAEMLGANDQGYWSRANANPFDTEEDIGFGIDKLVEHGRAHAAVECLGGLQHKHRPIDPQRTILVLEALLHSSEDSRARDDDTVTELIKMLQEDPRTSPADLFKIEWAFLPLLQHGDAFPRTLAKRLSEEPEFFCEVIRLVFRSRKAPEPAEQPTEERERVAGNAYRLLHRWNIPPGLQNDGSLDGAKLVSWVDRVRAISSNSGHLDVSLNIIGTVLTYSPPDPDGLWLHKAAAEVLNAKDVDDMRSGFRTQLFNSRGVHYVDPEGSGETALADTYHRKGEELEERGYHRLAATVKELAAQYRRDAEWIRTHQRFDD